MTMLDIAGGILIAGGIISLIAFGLAGYFNHEAGALAVWIILVGFATAGAVIFHSYIPAAATALLEQVRNNNPSLKWPENPFAPE